MRIRATLVTRVAGSVVALGLSPFLMGGGCGPDPEDLVGIAAVYNTTDDQLTAVAHGKTEDVTVVLEAGEAVFFEVRQSVEPYRIDLMQGSLSRLGGFTLSSGGEFPGFVSGVLTVSSDDDTNQLIIQSSVELSVFTRTIMKNLSSSSAVFLVVNASDADIGIGRVEGSGSLRRSGRHIGIVIEQGETETLEIDDFSQEDALQILHEFAPPISEDGDVSAFLSLVTVGLEGIEVDTREARFRRLQ